MKSPEYNLLSLKRLMDYIEKYSPNLPIRWHLFTEVDSTNEYLKKLTFSFDIEACLSETQTQGKGRFGRDWNSPFGENFYGSFGFTLDNNIPLHGLSLVVGLAILKALEPFGIKDTVSIKWPNDLYWQNKKLAGILIELTAFTPLTKQLIIGIGINVQSSPLPTSCCLKDIILCNVDRNLIALKLALELNHYLKIFMQQGFAPFILKWQKVDLLQGKTITIHQLHRTITGIVQGINEFGELCLKDNQGIVHYLSTGDCSIIRKTF